MRKRIVNQTLCVSADGSQVAKVEVVHPVPGVSVLDDVTERVGGRVLVQRRDVPPPHPALSSHTLQRPAPPTAPRAPPSRSVTPPAEKEQSVGVGVGPPVGEDSAIPQGRDSAMPQFLHPGAGQPLLPGAPHRQAPPDPRQPYNADQMAAAAAAAVLPLVDTFTAIHNVGNYYYN